MLNPGGGVVADVTVGRLADDLFLVVTGTSALDHDLRWLVDHVDDLSDEDRASVSVRDVTSAWACFGVWGPLARDVLAPVVDVPLDSAAFPYMRIRAARLADTVPVRMSRVTFVGELGWEVYVPTEYGRSVWELLSDAVAAVGGLRCGYRAIDSLRVEKGYLYLGTELTADRTPVASGLRRYVSGDKEYVGKDHVLQAGPPAEQLVCLTLDGSWVLLDGGEPVLLRDGRASTVTSGGLGYTVGLAVGFAFLPSDVTEGSPVEVLVDGRALEARVARQPLYDPSGSRIRA
jgi:4-methylaminobutanoate oxidase (formaldehyde-forming)